MKDNLLRYNKNQKYLIFDFETCSLNLASQDNKPWQIAFIIANNEGIIESHNHYPKWKNLNVSNGAAIATKFSKKSYNSVNEDPLPVLKKFEKYLYDKSYMVVGHNLLGFDVYIHSLWRKIHGLLPDFSYLDRLIDTNCLAKAYKENIKFDKKDSLLTWQFRLNDFRKKGLKTNQAALLREFQIDFNPDKLHDAVYDIEKNFEVFRKLIWRVEI
tara:strand:+ start:984 stop:1625 length:642 start_codon:yes stop_codon:yes gene_type:complete